MFNNYFFIESQRQTINKLSIMDIRKINLTKWLTIVKLFMLFNPVLNIQRQGITLFKSPHFLRAFTFLKPMK